LTSHDRVRRDDGRQERDEHGCEGGDYTTQSKRVENNPDHEWILAARRVPERQAAELDDPGDYVNDSRKELGDRLGR